MQSVPNASINTNTNNISFSFSVHHATKLYAIFYYSIVKSFNFLPLNAHSSFFLSSAKASAVFFCV